MILVMNLLKPIAVLLPLVIGCHQTSRTRDNEPEVRATETPASSGRNLLPEIDAVTLLTNVLEKYAGAKSLQFQVVRQDFIDAGRSIEASERTYTMKTKVTGKFVFTVSGSSSNRPLSVISDGRELALRNSMILEIRGEQNEFSTDYLRAGMIHCGIRDAVAAIMSGPPIRESTANEIRDVQFDPDNASSDSPFAKVRFTLKSTLRAGESTEILCIDKATLTVLSHESRHAMGSAVETYSNVIFDESMPDDIFSIE